MNRRKIVDFLGLNIDFKKQIKDILIAIIFSSVIISILIYIKIKISNYTTDDIKVLVTKGMSISGTIAYGIFCLIQEIFARGILQRLIKRKTKSLSVAIVITTIIFCLLHFNYDVMTVIGAMVISIIAGITTDKDNNIIRGFYIHWIMGGFGYVFFTNMVN